MEVVAHDADGRMSIGANRTVVTAATLDSEAALGEVVSVGRLRIRSCGEQNSRNRAR